MLGDKYSYNSEGLVSVYLHLNLLLICLFEINWIFCGETENRYGHFLSYSFLQGALSQISEITSNKFAKDICQFCINVFICDKIL